MKHTPNPATAERPCANRMVGLRVAPDEFVELARYARADRRSIGGFARLLVQKALADLARAEGEGQGTHAAIAEFKREGR